MNAAELRRKEHRLAQKARGIYQHQHELQSLEEQKEALLKQKPSVAKEQLSYLESVQFGKKIEQHKKELEDIDLKIQKVHRELNGLKKQAKKLLPATEVKIKVSTHLRDESAEQTFCIQYIKSDKAKHTKEQFQIQPLKE